MATATAPTPATAQAPAAPAPEVSHHTHDPKCPQHLAKQANKIVLNYTYWSLGVCLLPFPGLDVLGVAGLQLKMLSELSEVYSRDFKESRAKSLIAALAGSIGASTLLTGSVASLVKFIPGIGSIAGGVALTTVAGASTYAVGKVFTQHFASGGTFLDFDPVKTETFFAEQFKAGKLVAEDLAKTKPAGAAAN